MIKCSQHLNDCFPICDYCESYNFDQRICSKHKKETDPDDGCDDFKCFTIGKDDD